MPIAIRGGFDKIKQPLQKVKAVESENIY